MCYGLMIDSESGRHFGGARERIGLHQVLQRIQIQLKGPPGMFLIFQRKIALFETTVPRADGVVVRRMLLVHGGHVAFRVLHWRLGEEEEEYNIADVQAIGDEVTRHALAIDDGERLASVEKKEDIMSVYHCAPHVFNGKGERAVHDQNK